MAVQASPLASESAFAIPGKLIGDRKGSLSDISISACMCVTLWQRALKAAQMPATFGSVDSVQNFETELVNSWECLRRL